MKLLEFITKRIEEDPDYGEQIIKVGSASAFFYCGTARNFLSNARHYDSRIRASFKEADSMARERYNATMKNPPRISDNATEDTASTAFEDFEQAVKAWVSSVEKKKLYSIQAKHRLDGTVSLSKREVIENYACDPVADDGVEIILCTGYEKGRIWMSSEVSDFGEFAILGDCDEETDSEGC